jgi:hypothetical protein
MDTWQFYQDDCGMWCWKHVDAAGLATQSERCFASRTDCIADAMRHGYLARAGVHNPKAARSGPLASRRPHRTAV